MQLHGRILNIRDSLSPAKEESFHSNQHLKLMMAMFLTFGDLGRIMCTRSSPWIDFTGTALGYSENMQICSSVRNQVGNNYLTFMRLLVPQY